MELSRFPGIVHAGVVPCTQPLTKHTEGLGADLLGQAGGMRQGENLPQLLIGGAVAEVQQAGELSHGRAILGGPPPAPGTTGQICSQTQNRECGQQGAGGAAGSRAGPYLETAPAAPAARPAATRGALPASGRARRGGGGRRRARPALPRCGCTCGPGSAARSAAALFAGGRGAAPRAERRPLAAASGS